MTRLRTARDFGSIVYVVGLRRVYGLRGRLTLPTHYAVYDEAGLAKLARTDPDAEKHNYFDSYMSLCGTPSGEDARVEAGLCKYSGRLSNAWKSFRCGVAGADFHGDLLPEGAVAGRPLTLQLGFKAGEQNVVEFKIDGHIVAGPMRLNLPISRETYGLGGLYPKASIGLCNFGGAVSFGRTTLTDFMVNHSPDLHEGKWTPIGSMLKHDKFTNGDRIESTTHPFSAMSVPKASLPAP